MGGIRRQWLYEEHRQIFLTGACIGESTLILVAGLAIALAG
jgi:hypothetical protein